MHHSEEFICDRTTWVDSMLGRLVIEEPIDVELAPVLASIPEMKNIPEVANLERPHFCAI